MTRGPDWQRVQYGDIAVCFESSLDGGGMTFGQHYVDFVRDRLGKVGHVFEYCAGPGFIGFSLLAENLCDRLTLADINPRAVAACRATVSRSGLESRVDVYEADGLHGIPETEKWDLVVSNPPHFRGTGKRWESDLRLVDPGFAVHKKLYAEVRRHLAPGGKVIVQEHGLATGASDFGEMIANNGLRLVEVYPARDSAVFRGKLHRWRSRTLLVGERLLNTGPAEKLFKRGPVFRRLRNKKKPKLWPYYFVWSEVAD